MVFGKTISFLSRRLDLFSRDILGLGWSQSKRSGYVALNKSWHLLLEVYCLKHRGQINLGRDL